jgi:predicted  nucleic acid-binding Zn-ribbon protein
MSAPRLLFQLQETDIAIAERRQQAAAFKAELAADPLAVERAAIAAKKDDLEKLRHDLREIAAEVDDFSARIKHHEDQLYSGRVTSPKELSALQKDIALLKSHRSPGEDQELSLMETIEETEKAIDDAEIALQRHKEALSRRRVELSAGLTKLEAELAGLEKRRQELSAELPPAVNAQYDLLKKQKCRAVARLEQGVCRGCGIAVTTAWVHRARAGEVVGCPSCGRILYLE